MNETYSVIDRIAADTVEVGDQVIIDAELIEVTAVGDDPTAPLEGVRISGYSNESGDIVTFDLHFSEYLDVWSV